MLGNRILKSALSAARKQHCCLLSSSATTTRLGTDVLPTMSQAVIHNDIVYLSGQVDGTAEDVVGQTKKCQILMKISQLHNANLKRFSNEITRRAMVNTFVQSSTCAMKLPFRFELAYLLFSSLLFWSDVCCIQFGLKPFLGPGLFSRP